MQPPSRSFTYKAGPTPLITAGEVGRPSRDDEDEPADGRTALQRAERVLCPVERIAAADQR
jgi:hypothetical protein